MNKRLLGGILIIIVIAAVGVVAALVMNNGDTAAPSNTQHTAPSSTTSNSQTNNQPQAETTNSVTISNYAYSPAVITVKVGTTVTWTNQDSVGHTVTADSGTGPDSELIDQGKSYSYTFDKAGTFTYHCSPHPYMKGTVIVTQ
jgi:amicyanin